MPFVISRDEWNRIGNWTNHDKEDPEVVRIREYVKYLDTESSKMTKTWPNSLENVNKRNEELRRARIEVAEQANTKFYKRYLKRQREEQQRLMYSARDTVFKNKDAPKLFLSAVIETAIQKERTEQIKFLNEQRRQQAEQKRKDDDEIIRKAKEWEALLDLKKKRRFEANKQHQKDIVDQAHEIAERNRTEYESELKLQQLDNIKANQQIDAIKEFEDKFKATEKARIWSDMERSRQEAEARREEQASRDRMDDRLIEVLQKSRTRTERKRLQTEKDIKTEKLRVLEQISAKLESGDAAREATEQAILNKAIKEKDAIEEAKRQAQVRKQAQFKRERIDIRNKYLEDEARRLHEFNTTRQWEIMNRFKNAELFEEFKEKLRLEKERKVKEYREDVLRLWKEREEREARVRAETRYFYGELAEKKLRDADNKLFTHAAKLIEEARAHGRPDHALHKAVDRYCKLYRLYPMPDLPSSMKEHFKRYAPWDGSKSDPWYKEPPPPPPDLGPDAPDEEDMPVERKQDGLQDPKPGPSSKPKKVQTKETVEDYKLVGRANGLQRKVAQLDPTLPPISVVPCKTDSCKCGLKQ
ncbi:hypothetical protein K1T71_009519 [Dendrolimus kikuchii]|uniref:Uncharacterized protein n=1 Tax=Dendrolimus kikuchii TaxID=765133 RepID=A0ACC1CS95_9NEOP|nr:hypothetical protein K1T71_009519 [Dendrolimus kikuchii]